MKISACTVSYRPRGFIDSLSRTLARRTTRVSELLVAEIGGTGQSEYGVGSVRVKKFGVDVPPGIGHAMGLHQAIDLAENDIVMPIDSDVVIQMDDIDEFYLDLFHKHDLKILGASHYMPYSQSYLFFPTVINCMFRKSELPGPDYLQGRLKIRNSIHPSKITLSEDACLSVDGKYLVQTPIPEFVDKFPNPNGAFDCGCNLWIWFHEDPWLCFNVQGRHQYVSHDYTSNVEIGELPQHDLILHRTSVFHGPWKQAVADNT